LKQAGEGQGVRIFYKKPGELVPGVFSFTLKLNCAIISGVYMSALLVNRPACPFAAREVI
jgi:hypothetical protein